MRNRSIQVGEKFAEDSYEFSNNNDDSCLGLLTLLMAAGQTACFPFLLNGYFAGKVLIRVSGKSGRCG
jgi:hypothetical protein